MKELKDLVAGDKVVVYDECNNRRIAIVERITKTLVVVNNIKYRKSDGFEYGVSSYIFSHRIEIPKDEEQIKAIELDYNDFKIGYDNTTNIAAYIKTKYNFSISKPLLAKKLSEYIDKSSHETNLYYDESFLNTEIGQFWDFLKRKIVH